jgi:sugar phosphate isomerase/epimerase
MSTRRSFLKNSGIVTAGLGLTGFAPLVSQLQKPIGMASPKISLAQWSLHRALESKSVNPEDFATIASREYGIKAVEYVNSFYMDQGENENFWKQMKERADMEGVKSLLIMVDNEGALGDADPNLRKQAVENHYKWIHASKILGGHSIRVNAFGNGSRESLRVALTESLGQLAAYGAKEGIHVLIENHGLHTSDARFMAGIINDVAHPYLGTLPDFGNWCLTTEWGSTQDGTCKDIYDPAAGLATFLPYARGVSAKSYNFNDEGYDTVINYPLLLSLVKASGYSGYIGIEYEGMVLPEPDGIRATKKLIEKVWTGQG